MHLTRISLLVALPLLASATFTEKAWAATCDSLSCTGTISQLSVFKASASSAALVRLDTNDGPSGSSNCTLDDGNWAVAPGDSDLIRTLTAAYLAGRTVKLRKTSSSGFCKIDYVTVY